MKILANLIIRFPKTILFTLLILTVVAGYWASKARVVNTIESMFMEDDPDLKYYYKFRERFGSSEIIALAFKCEDVFTPENLRLIRRLTGEIEGVENVIRVLSLTNATTISGLASGIELTPLIDRIPDDKDQLEAIRENALNDRLLLNNIISRDSKTTAIIAEIADIPYDDVYRMQITRDIRRIIEREDLKEKEHYLAGVPVFLTFIYKYIIEDLKTFLPLSYGILIIVLFVTFRNLHGVFLPLIVVACALAWTMAVLVISGKAINLGTSVIPPIVVIIGVAAAIHIITHYYEECAGVIDRKEALKETASFIGIPCFLTSLTTAFGFGSLAVSRVAPVRETGIFTATGVMFAFLIAITLIPAVLIYLKPPRKRQQNRIEEGVLARLLQGCGILVERHHTFILVVGGLLTLGFLLGLPRINVETNLMKHFKKETEIHRSHRFLEENLTAVVPMDFIITTTNDGMLKEPEVLGELEEVEGYIESIPEVTQSYSILDYLKETNKVMNEGREEYFRIPETRELVAQYLLLYQLAGGGKELNKLVNYNFNMGRITARLKDMGSNRLVEIIRDTKDFIRENISENIRINFSGTLNLYANLVDILIMSQIKSLFLAMAVIAITMMVLLRSVRLGLLSMVPNVMPILFAMGFMGHYGIDLNVSTSMMPSIGIGLAVDDTIHFLARYRKEIKVDGSYTSAVYRTLRSTGRAITFTSVILFFGYLVFVFSNFGPNLYFGILCSLIMVVALFGDLLILPALLILFKPRFR